jgi:hypothetical protein
MRLLLLALLLPVFIIPVYAQENATPTPVPATAPTIPLPPPVTTTPNPNLQYVPQKAYIVTTPDGQTQAFPVAESTNSGATNNAQITGIVGIVSAIGAGLWAKMSGTKQVKETNAAVLNTKDVQKEIARVMYNFQPDQSKALSDAPAIKLEALEKDRAEFATKVAKQ